MKVLIPAAGAGTRLRPHTFTTPKPLLFVAGKPMIDHILAPLRALPVEELILVVSPDGQSIVDHVARQVPFPVRKALQLSQRGLGDAVYSARDVAKGELLIILGDTIARMDFASAIARGSDFIGVKEVEDPRRFGVVEVSSDGTIVGLEEKPERPRSHLIIAGVYYFRDSAALYEALEYVIRRDIMTKGEYQLTDALRHMLTQGWRPLAVELQGWYDCGNQEALLATNRVLLDETQTEREVPGSLLVRPVYIAEGVEIERSIVGPYVSVDRRATIRCSIVRDSVINGGALIENCVLEGSIVGKGAIIRGTPASVNLGDLSSYSRQG